MVPNLHFVRGGLWMPNEGFVYIYIYIYIYMWGSVPSSLFRGFVSLWMAHARTRGGIVWRCEGKCQQCEPHPIWWGVWWNESACSAKVEVLCTWQATWPANASTLTKHSNGHPIKWDEAHIIGTCPRTSRQCLLGCWAFLKESSPLNRELGTLPHIYIQDPHYLCIHIGHNPHELQVKNHAFCFAVNVAICKHSVTQHTN